MSHQQSPENKTSLQQATFGGGCFWCTEAIFLQVNGVVKVQSGYAGGKVKNPGYREICSGLTGHAEVIQITFDSTLTDFEQLLEIFWNTHDPTTLNRQGADEGTQYRSVVFYHSEEQRKITEAYRTQLEASKIFPRPIVTEITALPAFYPAEAYHQNYFAQNQEQGYCQIVIRPKVEKFRKHFQHTLQG